MLVVTANWGFTDGSIVAPAGRVRAGRDWLRCIRRSVVRSGFGRDGGYRPPAGLDVVLAGDTFDCLVSRAWCGADRPWHGGARADGVRRRVLLGCARRAAPFLAGLAALGRRGIPAPAADHRGRPSAATTVRIPVKVTLLPGDRDPAVAEVAAEITARAATVAPCWSDGTVLVGHGHEFDPACHAAPLVPGIDRAPTLAESVATDLVVPFTMAVGATAGLRSATAELVTALADSAPAEIPGTVADWIAAGGADGDAVRCGVVDAWHRAVDAWLRQARRAPPECGLPASPLESLAAWFQAARPGPPPAALASLFGRADPPTATSARAVVLGHPAPTAGDAVTVCLGHRGVRRCSPVAVVRADGAAEAACVAANPPPATPPTVACLQAGGRLEWVRIMAFEPATAASAGQAAPVVDAA